jgi:CelD/BcsL family acetyltransferase involved in cellulose biosynthesis
MAIATLTARVLDGFDDPSFGSHDWNGLLAGSRSDLVYMTWEFQRAWWETNARGTLLLTVAERDGMPVALAPFYAEEGMVYFVGSSFEYDALDFPGDAGDPAVLEALLRTAIDAAPGFEGMRLYFVPDRHGSAASLGIAADRLGWDLVEEDDMPLPVMAIAGNEEAAARAGDGEKVRKRERAFLREGELRVHRSRDARDILPQLEPLFDQHVARWAHRQERNPSRFAARGPRALLTRITELAGESGTLRFTRLDWAGRPIAYHYGYARGGRSFWGATSFAPDLAARSPGQILLRDVLRDAVEEGAAVFDFGTGDHAYKLRLATHVERVRTWGLYP